MGLLGDTFCKLIIWTSDKVFDIDKNVKNNFGFSPLDKMTEMQDADENLRHERQVVWTMKKIAVGTLKGIFGAQFSKD